MKIRTIEVCDAVQIVVDCVENDEVDVRCGGSPMLGYDFFISPDENVEEYKDKIREYLKKYKQPLLGIRHYTRKDFPVKNLWALGKIEKCIKDNPIV